MQVTPEVNVTAVLADITDSLTASVSRCMSSKLRADLHGTSFVSCDKLTAGLPIGVYVRKIS